MKQTYYHTTIYNIQNQTEITRSIPDFDPSLAIPCQDLLVGQGDGSVWYYERSPKAGAQTALNPHVLFFEAELCISVALARRYQRMLCSSCDQVFNG